MHQVKPREVVEREALTLSGAGAACDWNATQCGVRWTEPFETR
jgi:hypothetical protein